MPPSSRATPLPTFAIDFAGGRDYAARSDTTEDWEAELPYVALGRARELIDDGRRGRSTLSALQGSSPASG